ncbi:MAG: polyphenol oxidase family protein [Ignavibacteriales bacterium]|nr:polyphenol oxidase family protein [Ignavibacteriales bacterium]
MTDAKNTFLAVSIADCTPIMLYDPDKNVIAGIHAGWRGTSKSIVGNAVQLMKQNYSVVPANIVAFIGPSAGVCCYEVGNEVAELFPNDCWTEKGNGKFMLNVKKVNMLQLLANGVQESHIEVHPDCSIHNQQYHSFRRDGKNSGRMLAVIGIKK